MVTAVTICNMALAHIGDQARVTSISPVDGSTQSTLCSRYYDQAVNTVLEMHAWNFATKRVTLTQDEDHTAAEWEYAYEVPADMLRALAVQQEGGTTDYVNPTWTFATSQQVLTYGTQKIPQEFAIELNGDGEPRIYTDLEPDVVLRYIAYVTNPGLFSPLFIQAVSWNLASMLCGPIVKGEAGAQMAQRCQKMALSYIGKAAGSDGDQRKVVIDHVAPWLQNR